MSNFLTSDDLNRIQGLLHYLNEKFNNDQIDAEIVLSDSNGEYIGKATYSSSGEYVFEYGA